jgi:peptidoglycan/xylan/chitin deacetylase (PgdA/CDA1 family)
VLAAVTNPGVLVGHICGQVEQNRLRYNFLPAATYLERYATSGRFDRPEVVFCKRMLQRVLPGDLRRTILDELFRRHVTVDEASFARGLYMDLAQIQALQGQGMYIGSHAYDHCWLDALSEQEQAREVDLSLRFLQSVGSDTGRWIMCYPHGAYNNQLLALLGSYNCVAGLTTVVGLASIPAGNPLILPRIDTNDLPKRSHAAPNEWTRTAAGLA